MEHILTTDKQQQCQLEGDPDWWFDYNEEGKSQFSEKSDETRMAISICNRCDALEDCREFALQYSDLHGVWGGLMPRERTSIRRNMGITPIPFHQTWRKPTQEWIEPV